jgi:type II secretory pathway pseudopilin PulG
MIVSLAILTIVLGGLLNLLMASDQASARLHKHSICAAQAQSSVEQAIALGAEGWRERVNPDAPTWTEERWIETAPYVGGVALQTRASREPDGSVRVESLAQWTEVAPADSEAWRALEAAPAVRARALGFVVARPAPFVVSAIETVRRVAAVAAPSPTPRPTVTPTPTPPATRGFRPINMEEP